ncbi:hypothetical protein HY488_00310 [Candidatus Woesearchaeota archaeon]|nr:hypothetical protein [Candidatus Woesearchaeota archaeon]
MVAPVTPQQTTKGYRTAHRINLVPMQLDERPQLYSTQETEKRLQLASYYLERLVTAGKLERIGDSYTAPSVNRMTTELVHYLPRMDFIREAAKGKYKLDLDEREIGKLVDRMRDEDPLAYERFFPDLLRAHPKGRERAYPNELTYRCITRIAIPKAIEYLRSYATRLFDTEREEQKPVKKRKETPKVGNAKPIPVIEEREKRQEVPQAAQPTAQVEKPVVADRKALIARMVAARKGRQEEEERLNQELRNLENLL